MCGYFLLLLASAFPILGQAGSYSINPVKLELSHQGETKIITVRNQGEHSAVMQVDVVAWEQQAGEDIYKTSRDLLASPPVFTLEPGASQVIRLGQRKTVASSREKAYRLFIQEVPSAVAEGNVGLQMALRISVPVWLLNDSLKESQPDLQWYAEKRDKHTLLLSVKNNGPRHIHLSKLNVATTNSAASLYSKKLFTYVLAGTSHHWVIDTKQAIQEHVQLRIQTNTNQGERQTDIMLSTP
mgnify:FL=1